jgi:hypothetical protein
LYLLLFTYMTRFAVQSAAPLVHPPELRTNDPALGQKAAQLLYPMPFPVQVRFTNGFPAWVEMSNVTVSPKCGAVVETAVTGDPVGDAVTRYGPVMDDDPKGLAPNAAPANTNAETATNANAILLNTGVLLSVRPRTRLAPVWIATSAEPDDPSRGGSRRRSL